MAPRFVPEYLGRNGMILMIVNFVANFLVLCATIPYWIFLAKYVGGEYQSGGLIWMYILVPCFLAVLSVLGAIGTGLWLRDLLGILWILYLFIFLFEICQIAIVYTTYQDCLYANGVWPSTPLRFICQLPLFDDWFWIPQLIALWICMVASFATFIFYARIRAAYRA